MNTEISEIESEVSSTPAEKDKPVRRGSALAFLALVFALAALAGTAWMWWLDISTQDDSASRVTAEIARLENSNTQLSQKLQQMRSEVDSLPSNDNSAEVSGLNRRLEAGITETDGLKQTLNEQMAISRSLQTASEAMQGRVRAAESALAGMASTQLDSGAELDLAEVDYLLRLANERLQLFSDSVAADQALEMADRHLEALDNPAYLVVRQDIAAARREMAAVDMPDYFAISNELDALQESISHLPFRGDVAVSQAPQEAQEGGWWEKLKGVFSGLVRVRRSTEEENQRISLEDKDYIRQRLWLQLEVAHLSLMRRDQAAFRNSLARVQKTLSAPFDEKNSEYQALSNSLAALTSIEIQPDIPDISAPWVLLRQIREIQQLRPAAAVPALVPEQAAQVLDEAPAEETATANPVEIPEQELQAAPEPSADDALSGDEQG